jgi:hypothetical protein
MHDDKLAASIDTEMQLSVVRELVIVNTMQKTRLYLQLATRTL